MAKTEKTPEPKIAPFFTEDQIGKQTVSAEGLDEKIIREKVRAGLTREQAIEVLKAQKEADKPNKK